MPPLESQNDCAKVEIWTEDCLSASAEPNEEKWAGRTVEKMDSRDLFGCLDFLCNLGLKIAAQAMLVWASGHGLRRNMATTRWALAPHHRTKNSRKTMRPERKALVPSWSG